MAERTGSAGCDCAREPRLLLSDAHSGLDRLLQTLSGEESAARRPVAPLRSTARKPSASPPRLLSVAKVRAGAATRPAPWPTTRPSRPRVLPDASSEARDEATASPGRRLHTASTEQGQQSELQGLQRRIDSASNEDRAVLAPAPPGAGRKPPTEADLPLGTAGLRQVAGGGWDGRLRPFARQGDRPGRLRCGPTSIPATCCLPDAQGARPRQVRRISQQPDDPGQRRSQLARPLAHLTARLIREASGRTSCYRPRRKIVDDALRESRSASVYSCMGTAPASCGRRSAATSPPSRASAASAPPIPMTEATGSPSWNSIASSRHPSKRHGARYRQSSAGQGRGAPAAVVAAYDADPGRAAPRHCRDGCAAPLDAGPLRLVDGSLATAIAPAFAETVGGPLAERSLCRLTWPIRDRSA